MSRSATYKYMGILFAFILFIISITFCINNFSADQAFADSSSIPVVTVQSKTVHRGQTFAVDVNLSNNEGLISLFLTLNYDSKVMTLKT